MERSSTDTIDLGPHNRAFHAALRKYPDAFEALHYFWNEAFAGVAQTPKVKEGAMNLDRDMHLVVVGHKNGPYIPETDIARTSIKIVTEDLRCGQYDDVLAVIQVNPVEHTARDCTHDFQTVIDEYAEAVADARRRD
jgi:hypothetical protein